MSGQIIFFNKNFADFEKTYVTVTASEGQDAAAYILDRSNRTAWGTAGSVDASNTTLEINMGDVGTIDSILLLKHNFKNFLIQYWDEVGAAWTGFAVAINPTNCTDESSYFNFASVQTSKIKITIYGTQVANSEKTLCQFIATSIIGQLAGWPVISKPIIGRNLIQQKLLSGKSRIMQSVGFYAASLGVECLSSDADMTIIERLFNASEGFLFWPCGGSETQFRSVRQGYRLEDIYLCRCKNEGSPEWRSGLYTTGMKIKLDLLEVTT